MKHFLKYLTIWITITTLFCQPLLAEVSLENKRDDTTSDGITGKVKVVVTSKPFKYAVAGIVFFAVTGMAVSSGLQSLRENIDDNLPGEPSIGATIVKPENGHKLEIELAAAKVKWGKQLAAGEKERQQLAEEYEAIIAKADQKNDQLLQQIIGLREQLSRTEATLQNFREFIVRRGTVNPGYSNRDDDNSE